MTPNKKPPKIITFVFPTIGDALWMVAFFNMLLYGRYRMNTDGDLALHLRMGRYILDNGRIPLTDVFSHTLAGQQAAQHKWFAQMVFAVLERLVGLETFVLLCGVVIACAFWLLYKHAREVNESLISVVLVVILAMVTSMLHWLVRPHVFTFLFLAMWTLILHQLYTGQLKRWWILPALMVLNH